MGDLAIFGAEGLARSAAEVQRADQLSLVMERKGQPGVNAVLLRDAPVQLRRMRIL